MTHHRIEVDNLTFRYPDGRLALDDVTLSVAPDEKVALIGPNGSGKTTLLLHLNGILRLQAGHISIAGLELTERNLKQIRASLGMVFQNPDDQLFSLRVYDDVAFGPLHMGLAEAEVRARVEEALAAVGLQDFAERLSYHLSVGEKKRAAIATVLSMNPEILVLDEPSAGLDPHARRQLIEFLRNCRQQTMLISTHDMRLAYDLCARVVVLSGGKVVAQGPAQELLMNRELMERYHLETAY